MEIKKEKLHWIENITDKKIQIETDVDVIVPDSKPDIKKILQIDANVESASCEIQNDRSLVCGNVCFNVIYLPDDSKLVQNIKITTPFTDIIAMNGMDSTMEGNVEIDVLSINYKILNGRKFSVKCIVESMLKVQKTVETEIVSAIEDNEIQVKNSEVDILVRSGRCCKNIVINDRVIVPESESSIGEVLNVAAKINEYSVKLINNKAIIKGDIKIICTYAEAVNGEIATVNCVAPYTEILDIDGIKADDMCNAQIKVGNCEYNCAESDDGEVRNVEVKCSLIAEVVAFSEVKRVMIDDCYSTRTALNTDFTKIKLPRKICDINQNDTLKTNIVLTENEPMLERIYDAFSKAYIEEISVKNNHIIVSGVVDNYVLYVTNDTETPIYCVKKEVEFSQQFDCNGSNSLESDIVAEIMNTSYNLNSDNSVDLRVNLKLKGIIYDLSESEVITNVEKTDVKLKPESASIVVYFVQNDETLWDIAKKYYSTVEEIVEINELPERAVQKGMRLLIPKHKI